MASTKGTNVIKSSKSSKPEQGLSCNANDRCGQSGLELFSAYLSKLPACAPKTEVVTMMQGRARSYNRTVAPRPQAQLFCSVCTSTSVSYLPAARAWQSSQSYCPISCFSSLLSLISRAEPLAAPRRKRACQLLSLPAESDWIQLDFSLFQMGSRASDD